MFESGKYYESQLQNVTKQDTSGVHTAYYNIYTQWNSKTQTKYQNWDIENENVFYMMSIIYTFCVACEGSRCVYYILYDVVGMCIYNSNTRVYISRLGNEIIYYILYYILLVQTGNGNRCARPSIAVVLRAGICTRHIHRWYIMYPPRRP